MDKDFYREKYILSNNLKAQDLFDGRLDAFGIREEPGSNRRGLTDGRNLLWAYMDWEGSVSRFSAHGPDGPGKIFSAIRDAFNIHILSDQEPQYWGFATQEEWDAEKKRASDQARTELYAYVCAYVRGDPIGIKPDAVGEIKAKIAKGFVETDATLLHPENKDKLLAGIDAIYAAIHPVYDDIDIPF
ncbi:MAG: hypothetical protein Q8L63_04220 [Alphaproteobacteria bacterium]|nr:hypothetical protein [Alphaproteobacteria bacterium]